MDTSTYGTVGYEVYETFSPSNKLFLPAAGYRYYYPVRAGTDGDYWSAQYYNKDDAGLIYFDNVKYKWSTSLDRYFGAPVRPVKAGATPAEGHALSTSAIGEIVGSDGLAYAVTDKGNLPIGVMAVAMVAYKDGSNGLAIQLSGEPVSKNEYDAETYAAGLVAVTGGTWRLPSVDDWKNMFWGCRKDGDADKSDSMDPIKGFKEKIAATGTIWKSGRYWTRTLNNYYDLGYCVDVSLDGDYANASIIPQGPNNYHVNRNESHYVLGRLAF